MHTKKKKKKTSGAWTTCSVDWLSNPTQYHKILINKMIFITIMYTFTMFSSTNNVVEMSFIGC